MPEKPYCPHCGSSPHDVTESVIPDKWICTACTHRWPMKKEKIPKCPKCGRDDCVANSSAPGRWFCYNCGEGWLKVKPVVKTIVNVTVEGKLK